MTSVASPSPTLLTEAVEAIDHGNVQMWSRDRDIQTLIDKVGADGRWPQPVGRSVGLVGQNTAGNKVDQFLERRVTVRRSAQTLSDGTEGVRTQIEIRLTNNAPAEGLPTYILGPHRRLRGTLGPGDDRQMYSIYTSDPWTELTVDGKRVMGPSLRDGDWWVTRVVATIPQGRSVVIGVTAEGPGDPADPVRVQLGVNAQATEAVCERHGEPSPVTKVFRSFECG
jgi:hypothetical protein